jgi:DNA-binding MurR/RpiR family transcriptional regulator
MPPVLSHRSHVPLTRQELAELFERHLPHLSATRRRLAQFVLRKYQDVAFMAVADLAKATGVSPAAVVRFAMSLNFPGYPKLQHALRTIIRSELRQADSFTASLDGGSAQPLVDRILSQELSNLAGLRSTLDRPSFNVAVRQVTTAESIAVVGFRASSVLAHYLWYNLRKIKPDVRLYATPGSVTFDDIVLNHRRALVILFAFPRYSRELLSLAQFVQNSGFRTLGVTDNELSPLVPLCRTTLLTEVGEISFTDFYAAPLALMNALVAEVARRLRHRAARRLARLDDLADEQGYLFPGPGRRTKR